MTNEVAIIENINPVEVFKAGGAQPILDAIRKEVQDEVPDLTTKKGRDRIASQAYKVARSKTALDKAGKALADQLNAQLKPINAERKLIRDELDKLSAEIRQPLTDWENAEKERVESLKSGVQWFSDCCSLADEFGNEYSSENLSEKLALVQSKSIDDSWQEFAADAAKAKDAAIEWLTKAVASKQAREAEALELERLRQEQIAREQKEHEEQIAREAAERAKEETEAKAKAEAERVEREKLEAEQRERQARIEAEQAEQRRIAAEEQAKRDAEAAEQKRLADIEAAKQAEIARQQAEIQRQQQEQAAREADLEHRKAINNNAVNAMMQVGITQEQAQQLVKMMVNGHIPNVTINY